MNRIALSCRVAVGLALLCAPHELAASDWPQFMRGSEHSGDAAAETLRLPLGLATCVKLDDAVTTAAAVVAGRAYVVDQMGTAYCIDPAANRVLWKAAPDGERARGSNTSSPCVIKGRVYYGTTAGRLHILDAASGKVHKSVEVSWPVTGSPTAANDSIYFQDLGAIVHCLDLDGSERWRWDHYKTYEDPKTNKRASGFPGSWHDPHYGGGEVAVAGPPGATRVVVNLGWDLFCLLDEGKSAKLAWCQRAPLGKDAGIPMGPAIAGDYVYCGYPSTDQWGNVIRVKLADGSFDEKQDFRGQNWAVHVTPAVRDATVYWPRHYQGVSAYDFAAGKGLWAARSDNTLDQRQFTSCIASPALTKEHCVFGTISGDLYVAALTSTGRWPDFTPPPFKFSTALTPSQDTANFNPLPSTSSLPPTKTYGLRIFQMMWAALPFSASNSPPSDLMFPFFRLPGASSPSRSLDDIPSGRCKSAPPRARVGTFLAPAHAAHTEPLIDDRLACGFDRAGGDLPTVAKVFRVVHALDVLADVVLHPFEFGSHFVRQLAAAPAFEDCEQRGARRRA